MHDGEGFRVERGPDRHEADLERLARVAATGDKAALGAFLAAIHAPVVRFCRGKLIGSSGIVTADDVAQDVLMAVCDALPRFRPDGAVMAFVFGIARFKIVDAFRASGRDHSTPSESVPDHADDDPGPELAAVLATETVRLKAALALLPDHHREVMVLRVALGYTGEEVARMLGTTAGAVRVTQHRAVARLRKLLADPVPHEEPGG